MYRLESFGHVLVRGCSTHALAQVLNVYLFALMIHEQSTMWNMNMRNNLKKLASVKR